MLSSAAVATDPNGLSSPFGDMRRPASRSRLMATQPTNRARTSLPRCGWSLQSMELITTAPPAEFGDKTSLIATLGFGSATLGNFLVVDGLPSGRTLDTPEFLPMHAFGNSRTLCDRFDYQSTNQDAFHLDFFPAATACPIRRSRHSPVQTFRADGHITISSCGRPSARGSPYNCKAVCEGRASGPSVPALRSQQT